MSPAGENDGAQALEEWLGPRTMPDAAPFRTALTTLGDMMIGRERSRADIGTALLLVLHTGVVAATAFIVCRLTFADAVDEAAGNPTAVAVGIIAALCAAFAMTKGATAASLDRG